MGVAVLAGVLLVRPLRDLGGEGLVDGDVD
jgi:hypothetical protein